MTTDELYEFFGSATKIAESLNITKAAFYVWGSKGYIPLKQQKKIELFTKGKLKATIDDCSRRTEDTNYYLPKCYDKKHGSCTVESIRFRKGKPPKIICKVDGDHREKLPLFMTQKDQFKRMAKIFEKTFKEEK